MKIDIIQLAIRKAGQLEIATDTPFIYGAKDAAPIFIQEIGSANVEMASMLCLDNTNRIINYSTLSIGSIDKVIISIGQLMKTALISNASKIVIAHNHPSGILEITSFDIALTRKIAAYAKIFDIELLDSIVVNDESAISIREECSNLESK